MEVMPISNSEYTYTINSNTKKATFGDMIKLDNLHTFIIDKTPVLGARHFNDKPFTITYEPTYNRAQEILSGFSVTNHDVKTGVVRLTLLGESSNKARDIIDTLIAVYNEDANEDKKQKTRNTEDFILGRIGAIYGELKTVETDIENIRRGGNVPYAVSTPDVYVDKSSKYQDDAFLLESELSQLNFLKAQLDDPDKRGDYLPVVDVGNMALQRVVEKYNEEKIKFDESLSTHGENNPETKRQAQALESAREGVSVLVKNLQQSTRMRMQNARNQENLAKQYINIISTRERAVSDVMRQQQIKESLYMYLLNKREEIALSLAVSEDVAKTVEAASSTSRVAPDKKKYITMGFGVGIAIPFAILLLIALLDDRLKSKSDVEKRLTIPILCEIPSKSKEQEGLDLVVTEDGTDTVTEAFRIMYSNVQFFMRSSDKKVVQFLSSLPHEGKTYTAMNFASIMAFLGKKVVLLDLDCRKRSLSKIIDNPTIPKEEIDELITHYRHRDAPALKKFFARMFDDTKREIENCAQD